MNARREIVMDVDLTLAGGIVPAHLGYYNTVLDLGMSARQIAATQSFHKTFDVPQIIAYRASGTQAEVKFQQIRNEIRTSAALNLGLHELPGSPDGVLELAKLGEVSYYTVRPPEIKDTTTQWLREKGFPDPERVVICKNSKDKLQRIIDDKLISYGETGELPQIVLVDDSYMELAIAAQEIVEADPSMKKYIQHIILIGFGLKNPSSELEGTFYIQTGLRTLALPSWKKRYLKQMIRSIQSV